jgi:tryptophan synthase alpha chain
MSRIENAFLRKKAFIGFLTAGDPSLAKTEEFIITMEIAGVDLVEIGIPFSDPVAEGEVIQRANFRALSNGTNITEIFGLVRSVRLKTQIPLVFLTYLNPIFKFGYERFFINCSVAGIDGIIIPDLPFEEKDEIRALAQKYGIEIISLITPTSGSRIGKIAGDSSGFIYCVSSMGVTGIRSEIERSLENTVRAIKQVTNVPVAVGFGVATAEQAKKICRYSDGIIIGSAIVKIIEQYGNDASIHIKQYVKKIKSAICEIKL